MRRRQFLSVIGGAAAWPAVAQAQQSGRTRRIGMLFWTSKDDRANTARIAALVQALQRLGWVEGRNLQIESRWANGDSDRLKSSARELVEIQPDAIFGVTTPVIAALQHETRTIPIVFATVNDPVGSGFVKTLPRPGGNITGFIHIESSLAGKWPELLKEIAPQLTRIAIMFNPETAPAAGSFYKSPFETAVRSLSAVPITGLVHVPADIESLLGSYGHEQTTGVVIMPDTFTNLHRDLIISLSARHRVPAIYPFEFMADEGGLMSYGVDLLDLYLRAATYVDRILKGEKPADLPVQLPTKFELIVNLKTAKALGLTVSPSLLGRADRVIE
jgi:putative ABC transport system substrate-binding protein